MKVKEIYECIKRHIEDHPFAEQALNKEVVVYIDKPSVGSRAFTKVKDAGFGFDWEANLFGIRPEISLSPKSNKEDVYDMAFELIMFIATKPSKRASYEQRTCQSILERAGITDYMKYQRTLHGDIK